jgi:two-component system phosphate regulon sensor histidine kinase PhoR
MGNWLRSIRWRIAIPFTLLFLIVMAGMGLYLSRSYEQTELADLERELNREALLLSDFLELSGTGEIHPGELQALIQGWAQDLGARITIIRSDGLVLADSEEDPQVMDNHLSRPEIQQALAEGFGKSLRYSRTVGFEMMYIAIPLDGSNLTGFVRLALPTEQVEAKTRLLQRAILASTLLAAGLTIGLATAITNFSTRPLRQLTRAARRMSLDELEQELPARSPDEAGQLAQAFLALGAQLRAQIAALEGEKRKLNAVLEQLTDGVLIVDDQGKVQLINPVAARLFGVAEKYAIGSTLAHVLRHHQLVELWQLCRDTGQSQVASIDLPTRRLFLQSIAIPFDQAMPGAVLLVFQDLTQLRRLETVRRDFISNISHELRTPLASLKALTETLQDSALDDPAAARRFLARMETEVDSLSLMVQELLELSRIESGKVPLQLEPVKPGELLSAAAERLGRQAERASRNQ